MKLNLTKKTYYSLGAIAAALVLVQSVASTVGMAMSLLDSIAFGFTGLMFLFLASVKGTEMSDKRSLFGCFLLLVGSMFFNVPLLQIVLLAFVWPCFAAYEKNRDARLASPFKAVCLMEFLWMGLKIVATLGEVTALSVPANLAGMGAAAARLWLCVCLYRRERDEG